MKPKVSIVVLTYNNFENIEENIKSIIGQTYTDYEVIVHDDGSENFSEEAIRQIVPEEFKSKFKIKTNMENVGTVRNYNRAVLEADGDIIVPLSQDDTFNDYFALESIVGCFEKSNADVVFAKRIGRLSGIVYPRQSDVDILNEHSLNEIWMRLAFSNFISGSCLYWKKSFLNELGLFDEKYLLLEDHPILFKILEKGGHIHYLDILTVKYGENGMSSGKQISKKLIADNVTLYKYLSEKSGDILSSHLCRKFISFSYIVWKNDNRLIFSLYFIDIYFFLLFSRLLSALCGRCVDEYRIDFLLNQERKNKKQ